jgi:hypothetical protein
MVASRIIAGETYASIARSLCMSRTAIAKLALKWGVGNGARQKHRKQKRKGVLMVKNDSVDQSGVDPGFIRLASGKIVRYTPPEQWYRNPPGSRKTPAWDRVRPAFRREPEVES